MGKGWTRFLDADPAGKMSSQSIVDLAQCIQLLLPMNVSHPCLRFFVSFLSASVVSLWCGGNLKGAVAQKDRPLFLFPASASSPSPSALFLAIDERAFPLRYNLALFLTKPDVLKEPVLAPSSSPRAPDNSAAHFNGTVLYDQGKFRMWYYAVHTLSAQEGGGDDEFGISPVCYAESNDGIHWTRPNLGQMEWKGSRENNCIAIGDTPLKGSNCVSVIRDDDDPRPDRRYKMVFGFQDTVLKMSRVGTAVSADGLRWRRLPNDASGPNFAEIGSFYKQGGLYFVNAQIRGWAEGDRPEGRQGYAWVSKDFDTWIPEPAPSFKVPEPVEESGYGTHGLPRANYTQVHLGVGAASFGNVAVGLWGMWNNREPNWGEGGIDCHLGLVVSQDGIHFDEVVKGLPYIKSTDSPADPVPGKNYPTILHQSNSMFTVGNETFIYHGRWRNVDFQKLSGKIQFQHIAKNYWGAVALARIPRDRWGGFSLAGEDPWRPIKTQGAVWTAPITLPKDVRSLISLNASGLSGLKVEVADQAFETIPGFGEGVAEGKDGFDAKVSWKGKDLRELAGRTVRLRVHFKRLDETQPRLFAINFTTER